MRRPLARLSALILAPLLAAASVLPTSPARAETMLNIGTGGAFTSLDPHYHALTPNNIIAFHLFDCITVLDGQYKPVPNLALSWTAIDDRTWEFKLRPGVTYSDGTPFTPDDIAFTIDRIPQVLNSPASFATAVKPIKSMEVVDPLTIRLRTHVPEPLLPNLLANARIVSRKYGQGATTADYNSGKAAIGTGPYVLDSVILGDKVVFRRSPTYWGPKPYWDRVAYRLIANNASRTAAMQAGDVDIIDQVSTRDVALLKNNPRLVTLAPSGQRLIYLSLDAGREQTPFAFDNAGAKLARNPLLDYRVRYALSLAINRDGLRTNIMDGYAALTGQLVPEGAAGYTPDIKPDPYDPAKARALLAEAGYPQGFQITLHGPNDRYVNDKTLVESIAQMWTRVGVKTTPVTTPSSMFFSGAARDEYTASLTGWAPDTGEASSSLTQIVASSNPDKGRGAILKLSHYGRPDVDEVIERALATFDDKAREVLYQDATRMAMRDQAFIPLHHQVNIWAMRRGIAMRPRMQEGVRAYEVDPVPGG